MGLGTLGSASMAPIWGAPPPLLLGSCVGLLCLAVNLCLSLLFDALAGSAPITAVTGLPCDSGPRCRRSRGTEVETEAQSRGRWLAPNPVKLEPALPHHLRVMRANGDQERGVWASRSLGQRPAPRLLLPHRTGRGPLISSSRILVGQGLGLYLPVAHTSWGPWSSPGCPAAMPVGGPPGWGSSLSIIFGEWVTPFGPIIIFGGSQVPDAGGGRIGGQGPGPGVSSPFLPVAPGHPLSGGSDPPLCGASSGRPVHRGLKRFCARLLRPRPALNTDPALSGHAPVRSQSLPSR